MKKLQNYHITAEQFSAKISEICELDLQFVENDLTFYQKVSIAFLLFGGDKDYTTLILQKLLISAKNTNHENCSDFLTSYARINPRWRHYLLEALTIIKANRIIRKLGFRPESLQGIYLPHLPEVSLKIHPIIKALYAICESLTVVEAGRFLENVRRSENNNQNLLRFYDEKYLEIFLLDLIHRSKIFIGERNEERLLPANLDFIFQVLKLNEFSRQKDMLVAVMKEYNTVKSVHHGKDSVNRKATETKLTADIENRTTTNCKETEAGCENDSALANNDQIVRLDNFHTNSGEFYRIRRDTAGFILIINQIEFTRDSNLELQKHLPPECLKIRMGTEQDERKLIDTFTTFGYIPIVKQNLTHTEMINAIQEIVKKSVAYDSVIVSILSHGIEGAIYGSNSVPVRTCRIEQILASEQLLSKPKFLIVQACQGENMQKARMVDNSLETDGPMQSSVALNCDMLVALSTVEGFASIRDRFKGSWFIQTLCKLINAHGDRNDLLSILKRVTAEVSSKRGYDEECMVPISKTTLTKNFFLPKRC